MQQTSDIIEHILSCINENLGSSGLFVILKAYDNKSLPKNIDTIHFTVATEENKVAYFENDNLEACEKNTVKICINCYTPLNKTPLSAQTLSEAVMDLLCDEFAPQVKSCAVGKTQYDAETRSYKIACHLDIEYEKCAAVGSINQNITIPAGLFCKSHLADESLHVSEADRLYLNSPYAIGSYKGSGEGTENIKNITLGFRPAAVFVYRNSYHPCEFNTSDGSVTCNFGYSIGSTNLKGVGVTDFGFRVGSLSNGNVLTNLNARGGEYTYIAFR